MGLSIEAGMTIPRPKPITFKPTKMCLKCGINKKTGEPSCCAPGGSWVRKCGNPNDRNFAYTWQEGLDSCKHNAHHQAQRQISSNNRTMVQEFDDPQKQSKDSHHGATANSQAGIVLSHTVSLLCTFFVCFSAHVESRSSFVVLSFLFTAVRLGY